MGDARLFTLTESGASDMPYPCPTRNSTIRDHLLHRSPAAAMPHRCCCLQALEATRLAARRSVVRGLRYELVWAAHATARAGTIDEQAALL